MNSLIMGVPYIFIAVYIFIFGLCIGSFLNVAILRGLSGEDMIFTRSKCPKCSNKLKWYMNIPLLSYIFLRGKCAYCKCHISLQYPIIEFLNGLFYLISFIAFGFSLKTLFVCAFLSIFILLSATDIKETVIIDYHAYILLIFGLIYSFLKLGDVTIVQAILGAIFGFLFFELMARLGYLIANYRMFGEGDSLIALGLGAIFGIKGLLVITALSFLIQTFSAVPILVKKAFDEKKIKLAIAYIIIILSIFSVILINYLALDKILHLILTLLITGALIFTLKSILDEIKSKKESDETFENCQKKYCLMPFGPALIAASTICLFYLDTIKTVVKNFFF